MATKKRLISVDDAMDAFADECKVYEFSDYFSLHDIDEILDSVPTVDAVEVVRCKDCRFSAQHDPYDPMECVKWQTKWGVVYTTPDGYCHKGERKDNEKGSA